MLAFLAAARALFQMLPVITEGIKVAEVMFPQSGSGAQKLALVKTVLETAHSETVGAALDAPSFETIWPIATAVVAQLVPMVTAPPVADGSKNPPL